VDPLGAQVTVELEGVEQPVEELLHHLALLVERHLSTHAFPSRSRPFRTLLPVRPRLLAAPVVRGPRLAASTATPPAPASTSARRPAGRVRRSAGVTVLADVLEIDR